MHYCWAGEWCWNMWKEKIKELMMKKLKNKWLNKCIILAKIHKLAKNVLIRKKWMWWCVFLHILSFFFCIFPAWDECVRQHDCSECHPWLKTLCFSKWQGHQKLIRLNTEVHSLARSSRPPTEQNYCQKKSLTIKSGHFCTMWGKMWDILKSVFQHLLDIVTSNHAFCLMHSSW